MPRFDYKFVDTAEVLKVEKLQHEGDQGWELCHVEGLVGYEPVEGSHPIGDRFPFQRLWFKRARPES